MGKENTETSLRLCVTTRIEENDKAPTWLSVGALDYKKKYNDSNNTRNYVYETACNMNS